MKEYLLKTYCMLDAVLVALGALSYLSLSIQRDKSYTHLY